MDRTKLQTCDELRKGHKTMSLTGVMVGCAVGGQEMASLLSVDVMNLLVRSHFPRQD